jgi:hypothetical protein
VWMRARARRRHHRFDWFVDTRPGVRAMLAVRVISTACACSVIVPIISGAPRAVTIFWLLAVPPMAYAGLWLVLSAFACMWLAGWRPQSRP